MCQAPTNIFALVGLYFYFIEALGFGGHLEMSQAPTPVLFVSLPWSFLGGDVPRCPQTLQPLRCEPRGRGFLEGSGSHIPHVLPQGQAACFLSVSVTISEGVQGGLSPSPHPRARLTMQAPVCEMSGGTGPLS